MLRPASVAIAAAALALVLTAPAGAKELTSAQACDADRCSTLTSKAGLLALGEQAPAVAPARRAPFYRVRMTITIGPEDELHFTTAYIPALRLVRNRQPETGGYLWLTPSPRAVRVFDRLTRGLEPVPARRLRGIATENVDAATPAPRPPSAPHGGGGGGGLPWIVVLIPAVVLAAGAAAWRHRPRPHPAPRST